LVVDTFEYEGLQEDLETHIEELESAAFEIVPKRVKIKHAAKLTLSRDALLRDVFFSSLGFNLTPLMLTEKTQKPSVAYDHLMMFKDHPEVGELVGILKEWNAAKKTLSTYVVGFLKHLRPDGKFHPTYALFAGSMFESKNDGGGTNTGRTSAKNPAIQTLPKRTEWAKPLRRCYPAPEDWVVFQCDYSQGELKVVACVAHEEVMLNAYKQGLDLHAVTGARLAGFEFDEFMEMKGTPEFDKWRTRAKPANFGLLYGMGAVGYREYARVNYGLELTAEEAEDHWNLFFKTYPGLTAYHKDAVDLAKAHKFVRNPLGRVRHLPLITSPNQKARSLAERQAINAPIQSCLSDMTNWSIALLHQKYGDDSDLWVAGMTHDSIYGYVPEATAEEWVWRVKETMENLPFEKVGWVPELKFMVDCEIGPTMAHLEPVLFD
jgi:DNA polymerase I-like protein with 3'-5' exonuclease and polymerase domains